MSCPVVLQVFFTKHKEIPNNPPFLFVECEEFYHLPLWKPPDGKPVFVWSVDYIVTTDERWVLFGPFSDSDVRYWIPWLVQQPGISGYRIINEHCVPSMLTKSYDKWPRLAWTDG